MPNKIVYSKNKNAKPKISIVIPNMQEETLFGIIPKLRSLLGNDIEIIIVNLSSKEYLRRLQKTGVTILKQEKKGVEAAIIKGLRHAQGDILASIDADDTHELEGIKKAIALIENNRADFVLGNRFGGLQKESMKAYLRFGNAFLSLLYSIVYRIHIHDVLTGLFAVRRDAFDKIRDIKPYRAGIGFFAIEIAKKGYKIDEIPIKYYKRNYGESKLAKSKFIYGIGVAIHIIRSARDFSPLIVFSGIGILFIIAGLALGVHIFIVFLSTNKFTLTGRALASFLFLMIGTLFIIAGLIIDLLMDIKRKIERAQNK
ncbi:MAG: glycosyltransferase family 2 protein [Candidatus Marsarchaeota archaeon]|nr:glycosyltransferase family 2 protein [Candidatus Marsarchaeota archaeon]MCL5106249.1 glycosyltransferase family 2 protein [Candidatus Marsarchaeota archaeon]